MKKLVLIILTLFICTTNLFAKIDFDHERRYYADTLKINSTDSTKNGGILLQEVIIRDRRKSPKEKLEETKLDYKDSHAYAKKLPIIGIMGSPITALYNLFSKRAQNMRKLQRTVESDYHKEEIDNRYTLSLVGNLTGLVGEDLINFTEQYRPSYEFISNASDYEIIVFVKKNYQQYCQSHSTIATTPSLTQAEK